MWYPFQLIYTFKQQKRGRPSQIRLTKDQQKETKKLIIDNCPAQLNLPYNLWSRISVHDIIQLKFGLDFSLKTIGRYLKLWGLITPIPICRIPELQRFHQGQRLKEKYLNILQKAKTENAEIHWGGLLRRKHRRSDYYTRSLNITTLDSLVPEMRFSVDIFYSQTNQMKLQFMLYRKEFGRTGLIDFMSRLISKDGRKVILIVEDDITPKSRILSEWLAEHANYIELIKYPGW